MQLSKELINAFLSNLPLNLDHNECWPWMGGCTGANYGALWFNNKQYRAHHVSYMIFNGEIKKGLLIRHTCDNSVCVNPKHLITGTQSDNLIDALKRGRLPNHSLNEDQVFYIKTRLNNEDYYGLVNELAFQFNVNRKAIYKIKAGLTWKHVEV